MNVEIRPLEDPDMQQLARRLRPIDRLEVMAVASGRPLEEVLVAAGRASLRGRAGFFNGDLVACRGIALHEKSSAAAAPWLLATEAIDRPEVRRAFLARGTEELHRLTEGFRYLCNFVHRENAVARRWLRFMGFEFRDPRQYIISGEPFVRFEMGAA